MTLSALRRFLPVTVAVLAATVLSACSSGAWWKDEPDPRPCPKVAVLADAAAITAFKPGTGRDLTDILYEARFPSTGAPKGSCAYDTDDETGVGTIDVEFRLDMSAARGPADTTRRAPLQYFVIATDTSEKRSILVRKLFDIVAEFPGNRTQATLVDQPVYLTLPIKKGQTGADYLVFIGFQLIREQLDYNRASR